MNLHRLLNTLLATALAAFGFAASAAPLTGAVSSTGTLCLGVTAATAPGSACSTQDVSTMTYFDFIQGGIANEPSSAGTAGVLLVGTASGDIEALTGQEGSINDFAIPMGPDLSGFSMVDPLWTIVGTDGATYTYSLDALTSIDRSIPNALDVRGTGELCRNGTDCNLFSFIFTTQNAAGAIRTTYSLSQSGFDEGKVPEPASLTLLGLGLAGLAIGARRRRRS